MTKTGPEDEEATWGFAGTWIPLFTTLALFSATVDKDDSSESLIAGRMDPSCLRSVFSKFKSQI